MNLEEFFLALGKTKEKFDWRLIGKDIRASLKKEFNINGYSREYCPLTAVCFDRTGEDFPQDDYHSAANVLKFTSRQKIVLASDYTSKQHVVLRERILEAVGLETDFEDYVTA